MKKVYFMLLCAVSLVLVGCDEGNSPKRVNEKDIALTQRAFNSANGKAARKMMDKSVYSFQSGIMAGSDSTFSYTYFNPTFQVVEEIGFTVSSDDVIKQAYYTLRPSTDIISTKGADMVEKNFGSTIKLRGESQTFLTTGVSASSISISGVGFYTPTSFSNAVTTLRGGGINSCSLYWMSTNYKATFYWANLVYFYTLKVTYEKL